MALPDYIWNLTIYRLVTKSILVNIRWSTDSHLNGIQPVPNIEDIHTTYFDCSEESSILLDCGEGTAAQIVRLYGAEATDIYKGLKCVFISHTHVDHFMDLPGVLRAHTYHLPNSRDPLKIIGPTKRLKSWLFFYCNSFDDNDTLRRAEFIHISKLVHSIHAFYGNNASSITGTLSHFSKEKIWMLWRAHSWASIRFARVRYHILGILVQRV